MATDLIVKLHPIHLLSSDFLAKLEECPHWIKAKGLKLARPEREGTEPLENLATFQQESPRFEFRFNKGPKTSHGFVFGKDQRCDVQLPHVTGLSGFHFAVTYDLQNRLIIRDLGSMNGMIVRYGIGGYNLPDRDEGAEVRKNFQWIIGGDDFAAQQNIIFTVAHLSFKVEANSYDPASPLAVEHIQQFRKGTADVDGLVGAMSIQGNKTTNIATPTNNGPLEVRRPMHKGSHVIVHRIWNATTGEIHVEKEPDMDELDRKFDGEKRENQLRQFRSDWRYEASILQNIGHNHIVRLLGCTFEPTPILRLEYIPEGSLRDQGKLSESECYQVCTQLCSALAYLHDLEIIHRDINMGNILVRSREGGLIDVVFADFGSSSQTDDGITICGDEKYQAPEMWKTGLDVDPEPYTCDVDMWSLGVVILSASHCLPRFTSTYQEDPELWMDVLVDAPNSVLVRERLPNAGMRRCLRRLLKVSLTGRFSAQECFDFLTSPWNINPSTLGTRTDDDSYPSSPELAPEVAPAVESARATPTGSATSAGSA